MSDWKGGEGYGMPSVAADAYSAKRSRCTPCVVSAVVLVRRECILIRSGAISYGIDQLLQRAYHLLGQTPIAQPSVIEEMVESMIAPVHKLLAQVGGTSIEADSVAPPRAWVN
jgi:hypothetical protein